MNDNNLIKIVLFLFAIIFPPANSIADDLENFCQHLPRPAYSQFIKHSSSTDWFEVYEVESDIFAIYEPFQWQEVISYLIIGSDSALLFDTGNGIANIKTIVGKLTDKKIKVVNSHSHFDHIGGNYQFREILSPSTKYSIINSQGRNDSMVKMEVSKAALCKGLPEGVSEKNHQIMPYTITTQVKDGDIIDLGNRKLEVINIPGHTDDSIALLDKKNGLLWTGDSFYEGPIWLFFPETDLAAYQASIAKLVQLIPHLKALFPAHNTPRVSPSKLLATQKALELVLQGKAKAKPNKTFPGTVNFVFDGFGFLMRENYTKISVH